MKKGFYIIGKDKENSEVFNFGIDILRFDTLEQAKEKKGNLEDEQFPYVDCDIQILEVEK